MRTQQTHLVIKITDAQRYLNVQEQQELWCITRKIVTGREKDGKKVNIYLVVNTDEPYAEEVRKLVIKGGK